MESLSEKIKMFLSVNSGSGDGRGYGSGYGFAPGSGSGPGSGLGYSYGYDFGSGSGNGYGLGSGSGDCYGSGNGNGSISGYGYSSGSGLGCGGSGLGDGSGHGYGGRLGGIASYNGEAVYAIDGVPTVIQQVRDNVAKGAILNFDLILTPCYIAKEGNTFAHGETLHKAMAALREKLFEDMPEEERIAAFIEEHKTGVQYPVSDLYNWHHRLTGSCEMGRKQFARDHNIDIDHDKMTVEEFIEITKNAYGGGVIKRLREAYDQK